jgi:hypothetical protein
LLLTAMLAVAAGAQAAGGIPNYNHIFLILEENHNYNQIINNPAAPEINALAGDYGLATRYAGVSDPSEPNYVAMLGGSDFGINSDDPYWFPGNTVNQPNLMSQIDAAGLSWKGYFQGMPYAGYRGYCFPAKCNGIPDSDTQYVAKHNGIVNFASEQNATEFAKMQPLSQLSTDLASGNVPNLSYIVPDECHDMHGAPPWCVDSNKFGGADDNYLVGTADALVGSTVSAITSSSTWKTGANAIVIVWDEGNFATDTIPAIVVTNNGPRGIRDNTAYSHYSLLASIQDAFGLGCLQNSCTAAPMASLFSRTGSSTTPALPAPYVPAPDGSDTASSTGPGLSGKSFKPSGSGWQVVPSPSIGNLDNNLAAVSAASPSEAWAAGTYYPQGSPNVLANIAAHWNGTNWTAYPLPNVGPNGNSLLGVSDEASGSAWAVGYYISAEYRQTALVERYNGSTWSVVPVPQPGATGNILYAVAAISDNDVWAVGGQQDAAGVWHPLAMHWNGSAWSVSSTVDPNGGGNLLYGVSAVSSSNVYATGQTGTAFPSQALVEQWNGSKWSTVSAPVDTQSDDPFGLTATSSSITLVGARESDTSPFTNLVESGAPNSLALTSAPSVGTGENDLFAATTASDGSTWAAGWYIDPTTGNHLTITEQGVGGVWSIVPSPNPGPKGDNGFAGISAIPGGGMWAVGIQTSNQSPSTLIEYHP